MQITHQLVLALLHFEQVLFVLSQFCYILLQLCFFRFDSAHLVVFLPDRTLELGPGHDKGLVPLLEILPQSLDCLFFLFQFLEVLFHLADLVLLFADQFVPVLGLGPNRYEIFGPFLDVDGVVILFFIEFCDGILLVLGFGFQCFEGIFLALETILKLVVLEGGSLKFVLSLLLLQFEFSFELLLFPLVLFDVGGYLIGLLADLAQVAGYDVLFLGELGFVVFFEALHFQMELPDFPCLLLQLGLVLLDF